MLPGKKYTPEDYALMLWRRKWLLVVPTVVVGLGVFAWSYQLPNRYRAQVTIMVVPQRVPESFVRSTVTADVSERLNTISAQILSRTRLERIIEEFNLYREERQTMIMEDIIEQMRTRDVRVEMGRSRRRNSDTSSFSVSFDSSQPRTAMLVAERLASLFQTENIQDREVLADSTNQFLQAQLEDARRRLIDHEKKQAEFNQQNAGRLPSQMQSNMQMLQTTQAQIQANIEALNKDRDRLQQLEADIASLESAPPAMPARTGKDGDLSNATAAQQLEAARATLRGMEVRLKPEHPDVVAIKSVIRELEVKAEAEALNGAVSPTAVAASQNSATSARLTALRNEVNEIRVRIDSRKQRDARLQQDYATYTSRLEATPELQSKYTELMRDYNAIQQQYDALNRKSEESRIAVNLERRQIGEQFKILDGARLPERPISPDRKSLNLMGLATGFGLGLLMIGLLEYRDTTFKTDDDIVTSLALPVLAVIPAMVTSTEKLKQKRRRFALAGSAALATMLLVAAFVLWRSDMVQAWVR